MPLKTLLCPRGHTFSIDAAAASEAVCPICGATEATELTAVPVAKPGMKGLWSLMGKSGNEAAPDIQSLDASPPEDSTASTIDVPETLSRSVEEAAPQTSDASAPSSRGRGLWALMRAESPAEESLPAEPQRVVPPKHEPSLNPADAVVADDASEEEDDDNEDEAVNDVPVAEGDDDDEDAWELDDPDGEARIAEPVVATPTDPVPNVSRTPTPGRGAFLTGLTAVSLLPLHLSPWWWAKWPAGLVGLVALLLGHQALNRTTARRRPVMPVVAMVCGGIAMLAGPFFLNDIGHRQRQHARATRLDPVPHLRTIGAGLNGFHDEHGHFPPGGTTLTSADGEEVPLHGWMTELLPFIGREDLAKQVDRTRPFDHAANLPVMSTPVETYLVPGTPHTPTLLGLATTHFAGVGGDRETDTGPVSQGVFDRNSRVRRESITDGLSNTAVVGEIRDNIPAWGDPENWRLMDAGLNDQPFGFGNSSGTGAHFLMADGSVRFIPNHTSLEVLRKLSTRNAGD